MTEIGPETGWNKPNGHLGLIKSSSVKDVKLTKEFQYDDSAVMDWSTNKGRILLYYNWLIECLSNDPP